MFNRTNCNTCGATGLECFTSVLSSGCCDSCNHSDRKPVDRVVLESLPPISVSKYLEENKKSELQRIIAEMESMCFLHPGEKPNIDQKYIRQWANTLKNLQLTEK